MLAVIKYRLPEAGQKLIVHSAEPGSSAAQALELCFTYSASIIFKQPARRIWHQNTSTSCCKPKSHNFAARQPYSLTNAADEKRHCDVFIGSSGKTECHPGMVDIGQS